MVVAQSVLSPPTRADARRAADELVAAGASQVLLFGSVARGEATAGSDIDLVAVFDDLDYSERLSLRLRLGSLAEASAGCPVEVHVTDRPEWERRTSTVSSSFEARIAPGAVVLVDRPAGAVRWDKEIGLPANNNEEALGRLDEAAKALDSMNARLLPADRETRAFIDGDDSTGRLRREWRLTDVCSSGAMAVETAIKALVAQAGRPVPHRHDIDVLVPLSGDRAGDVADALAPLARNTLADHSEPYHDITIWRQIGTYIADRPDIALETTSRLAPLIAAAAVEVTAIASGHLDACTDGGPAVDRARQGIEDAIGTMAATDMITGAPTAEPP